MVKGFSGPGNLGGERGKKSISICQGGGWSYS